MNVLFTALIIEVIGAVIGGVFKSADFTQDGTIPAQIYTETSLTESGVIIITIYTIIDFIRHTEDYNEINTKNVELALDLDNCISDNARLSDDLNRLDKLYYKIVERNERSA